MRSLEGAHQATGERDLLARLRAAEEAVRARDDFIAIAAHELRSPMTAIALRLEALEQAALNSGVSRLAIDIQRTRRSVDRYVKRAVVLLDVSRINSGEHAPVRSPVRIGELVRDVVESHEDEARFHGARITAEIHGDHVAFWDPHMAEQIVSNLVNNAIKYGAGTPVSVRATVQDGVACIAVSDCGPGISDEQRARIFDKFERVVSGIGYRSGYGLGLWIVARMVRAHGGTIDISAVPGGGALFLVRLPLGTVQAARQEGQ
jgi:two-component system, OmpR family, sensor kinase